LLILSNCRFFILTGVLISCLCFGSPAACLVLDSLLFRQPFIVLLALPAVVLSWFALLHRIFKIPAARSLEPPGERNTRRLTGVPMA